jgi:hypothetical protein
MAHTIKYIIPVQKNLPENTAKMKQVAEKRVLDEDPCENILCEHQEAQQTLDLPDSLKDAILIALHKNGSAEVLLPNNSVENQKTFKEILKGNTTKVTSLCTINYIVYETNGDDPRAVNVGGTTIILP